ncbi:MAG: phosphate ABC transporter permease subunit PstC [Alicyclobacillus macrosporangiidus]|uniref:phosphate ABC transporter permease subunit PstC n=1 Tax=Alicyclobacillus macrosporangiidus TaxID=392015 RepID=UPI0026F1294F|nr:phosphate ABC transporter permease subunit PstC [Alicyclobacillus macrosporangiidus]MCL6597427.1 phosphate ABC transporter permease subunit PstC [Alicyclobacillus macrosporangiidus]
MKRVSPRSKIADRVFLVATGLCASSPILFLLVITGIVVVQSIPSIRLMGWDFLTDVTWNMGSTYGAMTVKNGVSVPVGASYGALPFIVGTLASSVIALLIAVPISVLTAVILAYRVRGVVKSALSVVVELLAGIPSVVIGLWGIVVLAPWVSSSLGPFLTHFGAVIPFFRGPVGTGLGLLTSGLVLALMVVPIITATTRDLLEQVPVLYREGGTALGMTSWEVVRLICLPYIKEGMIGAVALGWGRAMGETMAVLMVSGSAINYLPHNIYSPISTMAAVIADQLDSAMTDASHMAVHALSELALVLLVLTLLTNLIARLLVNRSRGARRAGVGVKA